MLYSKREKTRNLQVNEPIPFSKALDLVSRRGSGCDKVPQMLVGLFILTSGTLYQSRAGARGESIRSDSQGVSSGHDLSQWTVNGGGRSGGDFTLIGGFGYGADIGDDSPSKVH